MSSSSVRLAALIALAAWVLPAQAQDLLPAHAGIHILTVGPDGGLLCDEATEVQAQGLHDASANLTGQSVRLTPLPSLNAEGTSGFRIILRATDQLLARPEALLAFRRSAARWERILQDNVTTVIDVDYGPERFGTPYGSNVLGSTNSALLFAGGTSGAADMVARMLARANSPEETALYNAIPTNPTPSTDPEGDLNRGVGGKIPLQVLGYEPAVTSTSATFGSVPSIGFNDAFPYDFDPTDGIDNDKTDFEGVSIHEIGHALGFGSGIGINSTGNNPLFTPWDLFRVRPDAVVAGESLTDGVGFETAERVVTPGPPNSVVLTVENGTTYFEPVQVFFDGPDVYEVSTATGARQGGDGQQASHWRDDALRPPSLGAARKIGIMDPNLGRGSRDELSFADIRMLDIIGYTVDYDPPTATIALSVDGQAITDEFLVTDPVVLGDVAAGVTRTVPLIVGNVDPTTPLDYVVETELTSVFPSGSNPTLSVAAGAGTVGPGGSTTLQLEIGGVDGLAIVEGLVRVRANDDNRGVIEIPVTFTTGGAVAPELSVDDVPTSLGDFAADEQRSVGIGVSNAGTFDLSYRVLTALAARAFDLPPTSASARSATPLFTADFEGDNPLAPFSFSRKAQPDRWQTRTTGPAALPGHSSPTALYFGSTLFIDRYADNTLGVIRTPSIDLSTASPDSRVTLSFAYYLQAETGFDIASVLLSVDGGVTYEELATSNAGLLRNTDDGWEAVTIDVPGIASFPTPVLFAFRFESDGSVTDEGWFLDDIVIDVAEGESPFYVTPVGGIIPGDGSVDLDLTVNASLLESGFYRGTVELRTDQPGDDPAPFPIDFSVGGAVAPSVQAAVPFSTLDIPGGTVNVSTLRLQNGGDATLSFVRVMEPATSRFEAAGGPSLGRGAIDGRTTPSPAARSATGALDDGDVLGAVSFGTSPRFFDLAQLPDGQIVLFDGASSASATATVLPRDLSGPGDTFGSDALGGQVTGAAYNAQTGSLWVTVFQTGTLVEVELSGGDIVPTGREVALDFAPFGMDYSPELDAFLIGENGAPTLFAITADGDLVPGYPAFVAGREVDGVTSLPAVSFTQGFLEMTGIQNTLLPRDQFGADFGGTGGGVFSAEVLGGSSGVHGMLRDRLDPDGSFFVTTRADATAEVPARLVRLDPPDLPLGVGTRVRATSPLFADRSVGPREAFDVRVEIDAQDLDAGEVPDELAFLTNNPTTPVVRFPLTLSVSPVASEAGGPETFTLTGVDPNPVGAVGRVRFVLAAADDVSVEVFDTLGRRVAVLADASMAAGSHELPFPASSLAPGVYVVRLVAGTEQATRTVTVVR